MSTREKEIGNVFPTYKFDKFEKKKVLILNDFEGD